MNLGDGGCSESRSHPWTPAWVSRVKFHLKERKTERKKEERERKKERKKEGKKGRKATFGMIFPIQRVTP